MEGNIQLEKADAHLQGLVVAVDLLAQAVNLLFFADVPDGVGEFLHGHFLVVDQVAGVGLERLLAFLQRLLEVQVREGQRLAILLHQLFELDQAGVEGGKLLDEPLDEGLRVVVCVCSAVSKGTVWICAMLALPLKAT